jgi:hypothetical protein
MKREARGKGKSEDEGRQRAMTGSLKRESKVFELSEGGAARRGSPEGESSMSLRHWAVDRFAENVDGFSMVLHRSEVRHCVDSFPSVGFPTIHARRILLSLTS